MYNHRLKDLLKGIPCEILQGSDDCDITGIVMDFRKTLPGSLCIFRRGLNVDGHEYIMEAIRTGAAAVLVEDRESVKTVDALYTHIPFVYTENTRKAMGPLAANFYNHPAQKMRLIGVTGTNGKTTTTYFIENILRDAGHVTGRIGTVGVQVNGEPLPIQFSTSSTPDPLELHQIFAHMLTLGVQDVVMEVSSHALALHKMEGLTFDVGVFTNLTQDHLDFHGTMQNYHDAKAELFRISKAAVVNADDASTPTMLKFFTGAPCLTYSMKGEAGLRALHTQANMSGMTFDLEINGVMQYFTLPMLGRFNVENALAAIGVAHLLGISAEDIRRAVAQITPVPGRFEAVPNERGVLVVVDYAHTPDGLESIINAVRELAPKKIVTLFGCGGDRDTDKRPQMGCIAGSLSDYVILTSDNPRTEPPMQIIRHIEEGLKTTASLYEIQENRLEAIHIAVTLLEKGDALIIAGKGHEDYQIIGTTKHPFDDREAAREALK